MKYLLLILIICGGTSCGNLVRFKGDSKTTPRNGNPTTAPSPTTPSISPIPSGSVDPENPVPIPSQTVSPSPTTINPTPTPDPGSTELENALRYIRWLEAELRRHTDELICCIEELNQCREF